MSFEPILLAPQKEEKESYPYGRVWRTAVTAIIILLLLMVATVLVQRFLPLRLSDTQKQLFGVAFAVAPFFLWLTICYSGERRALLPRQRLLIVAILGALVANAVGIPLVDRALAVDEWLTGASGTSRIIGFMLTVGIVQEFLKYAVVRYSVWPDCFRTRSDGIAYMIAVSIGYATMLNLNFALTTTANPAAYALRIVEITLAQIAVSTVMGYFLAELKIAPNTGFFWLPAGLLLSAFLASIARVLRGGLVVGGFSATATANNAFQEVGASVALVIVLFAAFNFLINNADERTQGRGTPELFR